MAIREPPTDIAPVALKRPAAALGPGVVVVLVELVLNGHEDLGEPVETGHPGPQERSNLPGTRVDLRLPLAWFGLAFAGWRRGFDLHLKLVGARMLKSAQGKMAALFSRRKCL